MYTDEEQGIYEITRADIETDYSGEFYIVTFGEYRGVMLCRHWTETRTVPITFFVQGKALPIVAWGYQETFKDKPFCSCLR